MEKQKQQIIFKLPVIACILFLLAVGYTWPLFTNFSNWGIGDWDHDIFMHAFPRDCLIKYHQLPLWCPYITGGIPYIGKANSCVCTPLFIPILIFGELAGVRILILLHAFIGLIGMYALSRRYGLNQIVSLVTAVTYNLGSFFAITLTAGMSQFWTTSYLPLIFYFYLKSRENYKYLIGSGFFLALVIGEGGEYIFVIIISFLLLYGLLYIRKRNFSMLAKSVIVGTLAGLFGAVKILPFLALMRTVPRTISDYSGFSLKSFTISLLYPHQGLFSPIWRNLDAIRGSYGPDENGMYVGGLTAVLAIIGMIYLARKDWRILAIFGVFCLFIFGDRLPVSLWALVRRLPVYHSMRVAQRLRFVFLMLLALFSGFGITLVWKKIMAGFFSSGIKAGHRRLGPILLAGFTGLIALNAIHMIFVNSLIFRDAFSIQPLKTVAHTDFKQISFSLNYDNTGLVEEDEQDPISSGSAYYYSYLNNWGTSADCLSHYGLPRNAQASDSIDYKGELYFAGGRGKIIRSEWTPNKITAELKLRERDRLVLNQNYYPGWHAESNTGKSYPVETYQGLLSVQIDREVTGIRLFYRPTEFVIGLLITVVTCLISMGVIIRPGR